MAKVGTAEYDVLISRAAVQREVNQASRQIEQGMAGSARQVEAEFKQSSAQIGQSLGDSAKKAESEYARTAKAAVGAFALYKGGETLKGSVDAASDLAEQQSKVGVVFGDTSAEVLKFAENAEDALGQSKRQALEAAGTFGNLFSSVGLAQDQSAKMSTTLTALGSDLASFNDVPVDDALTALRSGLVGETEPLKRFGVNLNEATLKAKAMSLGLSDGKAPLDANAKAQAAYALILEQTTTAQGDFARTGDSLANQQKKTAAQAENTSASFGENLVPAMKAAQVVIRGLLTAFNFLPSELQVTVVAAAALGTAFLLLAPKLVSVQALLGGTAAAGAGAAAGVGTAAAATGALSVASATGLGAVTALNSGLIVSAGAAEAMAVAEGTAAAATGTLTASIGLLLLPLAAAYGAYKAFQELTNGRGKFDLDLTGALQATDDELVSLAKQFEQFDTGQFAAVGAQDINVLYAMRDAVKASGDSIPALNDAIKAAEEGLGRAAERTDQYSDATTGAMDETTAAIPVLEDYAEAHQKVIEAAEGRVQQEIDIFEAERQGEGTRADLLIAVDDLAKARSAAAGDSDEYRRAQESITDAHEAEADAAKATQRAQDDLTEARKKAAETLEDLRFAAEGSVYAEQRAAIALREARQTLQDVLDNPDATADEKLGAELGVDEADLALRQAQDRREDAATAQAEADRKGVEGSDEVVAAKERVTSALDAQRDAETRTAEASQAAADVLTAAKDKIADASAKVTDAIFEEADQERALAELTGDAAAANDAYIESLETRAALLDPESKLRKDLLDYIEDLKALNGELERLTDPVASLGPTAPPGAINAEQRARAPEAVGVGPGRSVGRSSGLGSNLTVNMTNGPSAREVGDELLWPGGK